MRQVRKPIAPPTQVERDERTYNRTRERERLRREKNS